MRFFADGRDHEERLFLAGNRIGKTEGAGGYETMLHLTGLYPEWWPGYRFTRPVSAWCAGATGLTTRDIIQHTLMGPADEIGTGLIPAECIVSWRPKSGVPDAIDTLRVRHASGGVSRLGFKSYDSGRRAFEGTAKDLIWFDEEPPYDVYGEGLLRTTSTRPGERGGLMICTFTPMQGMSQTVLHFLENGLLPTSA